MEPPRTIQLFAHADMDGLVSAALTASFLREHYPDSDIGVRPIDFDQASDWRRLPRILDGDQEALEHLGLKEAPDGLAVVDFPAPEWPEDRFLFFADHHSNAYAETDAPLEVEGSHLRRTARGEPVFVDSDYRSCAALIRDSLERRHGWEPPGWAEQAVDDAHRTDTADYASLDDALRRDSEALALYDAASRELSPKEFEAVTLRLIEGDTDVRSVMREVAPATLERVQRETRASLRLYEERARAVGEHGRVYDFTDVRDPRFRRVPFAEFQGGATDYALQLFAEHSEERGSGIRGFIGRSPWGTSPEPGSDDPDFARLAEQVVGGGGHPYAAGFFRPVPPGESIEEHARQLIEDFEAYLRPLPLSHPLARSNPDDGRGPEPRVTAPSRSAAL